MSNLNNSFPQNVNGTPQGVYNPYARRVSDLVQGYTWSPDYFPVNGQPLTTVNNSTTFNTNHDLSLNAPVPNTEIAPLSTSALSDNLAVATQDNLNKKPVKRITAGKHKKNASLGPNKRPAFVLKLWNILNDSSNHDYIQWTPDGQSFKILSKENFENVVLPKYFKHKNYSSFVRQLNMYGWHKVQDVDTGTFNSGEEVRQFHSPNFIRGREDLLDNIMRNKGSKGSDDEEETDVSRIFDELQLIKNNQMEIAADLNRIRQDNQMLWKECYESRERHKTHAETFERILRFLASVYSPNQTKFVNDALSPYQKQRLITSSTAVPGGGQISELPTNRDPNVPSIQELMSASGSPADYYPAPPKSHRISTVSTDDPPVKNEKSTPKTVESVSNAATPHDTPLGTTPKAEPHEMPVPSFSPGNADSGFGLNEPLLPTTTDIDSGYVLPNTTLPTTDSSDYTIPASTSFEPSHLAASSSEDPLGITPLISNALYQSNDGWLKADQTAQHLGQSTDDLDSLIRNINSQGDSLQRIQDRIQRYSMSGDIPGDPASAVFDVDDFLQNADNDTATTATTTPGTNTNTGTAGTPAAAAGAAQVPNVEEPPITIDDSVDQLLALDQYDSAEPPSKKARLG